MNKQALELYIYMNSYEPVIEWLKEEGVTTKDQALNKLSPLVRSNVIDVIRSKQPGCLAGTVGCIKRVVEHFEDNK